MMPTQQEPTATVRVPRRLLDELRPIAAAHDRSLSAELRVVLDTHILLWLGLEPQAGALFALDPATISTLGYERETPVMRLWNQPVMPLDVASAPDHDRPRQ